ncbi:VWA domain-containing protein [Aureimonas endophytica]|uniref:VWA domain-containing protein n=1 Tax=Aureimonas endophytica TaxID=2027858 RepID=A0A916ZDY1_9HYPH|nr:VWA domain-containing protein [Aureimonas endophytica]GGD90920.1 VWA domain-containing protein [Aureimonas endophytica]
MSEARSPAADPEGRLADNITYFARTLRRAGMKLGPAAVLDAIAAVRAGGLSSRDDFYWTLHAVLVSRREDEVVFAEAFRLFWRSRDLIEKMIAMFSSTVTRDTVPEKKRAGETRASDALLEGARTRESRQTRPEIEIDARFTMSGREVLRHKDFAQMSASEVEAAKLAIRALRLPDDRVRTRRSRPATGTGRIDLRRTLQASARGGGELILPKFRVPREVQPPLVILADISGSMSQYTRIFLHFLHALGERRRHVHTFLFGTRLSNVTRALRHKDPDEALERCSAAVKDWSGGTRIAEALRSFNKDWSRRVLTRGPTVILITDGLERDSTEDLAGEMERLRKSCRRLIWLNPLLRFDGFAARARGVRAMLPYVDEFRPVHSLDAMEALCRALSSPAGAATDPRRWLEAAEAA